MWREILAAWEHGPVVRCVPLGPVTEASASRETALNGPESSSIWGSALRGPRPAYGPLGRFASYLNLTPRSGSTVLGGWWLDDIALTALGTCRCS